MLTLLAPLALFIYLLLGWHFCQTRLAGKLGLPATISHALMACGIAAHGTLIIANTLSTPSHFGASEALSLTAWLALLIYLAGKLRWNLAGIEPPLFAFAAGFVALSLLLPQGHSIDYTHSALSRAHFILAMLAQSFLFVSAGLAILMRMTDTTLHHHTRKLLARNLPPLLTLEKLLFGTILTGFALLTFALIAGARFNLDTYGTLMQLSHKTFFGLTSWLLFAVILTGHKLRGWRGRFIANWTLFAFSVLFLGYIGSRIVLEAILNKP